MTVVDVVNSCAQAGIGAGIMRIIMYVLESRQEARRARGSDGEEVTEAKREAAFYAEQLQITREKALAAGMTPADLGPVPHYAPQQ